MKISDMLMKLDLEIIELTNEYKFYQYQNNRSNYNLINDVNKIKTSFDLLKSKIIVLEYSASYIQKLKIKRDLKDLIKIIQINYSDETSRIFNIKQIIFKLAVKYNAIQTSVPQYDKNNFENNTEDNRNNNVEHSVENNIENNVENNTESNLENNVEQKPETMDEDDFYKTLQDKIIKIRKKVNDEKKKNGISCDDPVQIFSIAEIEEVVERQRRIERAMYNVQMAKRKLEEQRTDDARVVQGITEKIRRIKDQKENAQADKKTETEEDVVQTGTVKATQKRKFFGIKLKSIKRHKSKKGTSKLSGEKKKLPWYATIPILGAVAVSAVAGTMAAFNHNSDKSNKDYSTRDNSYSASLDPTETKKETNITEVKDIETTSTYETSSADTQTTTQDSTTIKPNEESSNYTHSNSHDTEETTITENPVIINIGDKISVSDGLKYTADCLGGGKSNKIGAVSWRPATEYSVDKVAFCYNGKILGIMNSGESDVKQELSNYATQCGIDVSEIDTSVLLSLVPGSGDTGWAQISIDEMEQNVSKPVQNMDGGIHTQKIQTHESFDLDR